ncbi:ADP-ribosylglycohydrolase family protein [Vreelandella rituensis]|uniref:ADP-ribosylglycohydrolase family protein n=1 Tax=Vreelandella rituensis TaxID=2282306 RepID=A0A368TPI6_9GAMM|nr:ADP-ribosylglycohydrolase family protein [Halomonas rituensis]RCV86511.1 ADP-ribosylglycohydrolase family protein [Halomonas rituensis]
MTDTERALGGMLALACGDALANGVEFQPRNSYPPITTMDDAPRYLPVGQWSDDTGLALCLGESLIACQGFNAHDQMQRYAAFLFAGVGWPCESPLIAGNTITKALSDFAASDDPFSGPTHPLTAGNGGLMRLLPVVLASYGDKARLRQWSREATRTTHGALDCLEASELLALTLAQLLQGVEREQALQAGKAETWKSARVQALAQGEFQGKSRDAIKAKGYVVDTLEAALWCFSRHDDLESALLAAANLGDDCDTVAAITGQLAGCCYGQAAIPQAWKAGLVERRRIENLALDLLTLTS